MDATTNTARISVADEIRRLSAGMNDIEALFRQQRSLLQRQGMSLPPGTLATLQQIRAELDQLAQIFGSSQTELHRLRALSRTAELINSTLDLSDVLNGVMDTVIRLTKAERGYLVLRNDETGEMEFRVARNMERHSLTESEFIFSGTIIEQVARSGTAVVTMDAANDERFNTSDSIQFNALRSILCVPLLLKGEVTGVVYADNRIQQGLFGDKELQLLQAFANQAAIAIYNAQLFESLQQSLAESTAMKDLLNNVFTSIASGVITTDRTGLITQLNEAACRILYLDAQACLGRPVHEVLPIVNELLTKTMSIVNPEEAIELEPIIQDHGITYLSMKLSPLRNSAGEVEGVAIVIDDLTELKQREEQLSLVRRYLPPAFVENIASIDKLGLGGERRNVTIMYIDVRGFNTFPSSISPQDLMELLNEHLTIVSDLVAHHNGVIDKYMLATEVMCLFNTQLNPDEDHAWQAVECALNIALAYRRFYEEQGDTELYFRIGVHTGVATMGNVGSITRREFTAIGDTVNLAHRLLENASPGQILVSSVTLEHCTDRFQALIDAPDSPVVIQEQEQLHVKNRREAASVYRLALR
jgi:adenylate cyclase